MKYVDPSAGLSLFCGYHPLSGHDISKGQLKAGGDSKRVRDPADAAEVCILAIFCHHSGCGGHNLRDKKLLQAGQQLPMFY